MLDLLRCTVVENGILGRRPYRMRRDDQPSTRKSPPCLMLRLGPTPISGVDVQVWVARFRDGSRVTWGTEHFLFSGTIDDPLALGLVIRNGLGYHR